MIQENKRKINSNYCSLCKNIIFNITSLNYPLRIYIYYWQSLNKIPRIFAAISFEEQFSIRLSLSYRTTNIRCQNIRLNDVPGNILRED